MKRTPTSVAARVVLGLSLLAAAVVWRLELGTRWTQRLPPGWAWSARFVGVQTWPDPETGRLPVHDTVARYDRSGTLAKESERPWAVTIDDRYTVRDAATGNVLWEHSIQAQVDPATGRHLDLAHAGARFVFPREVERRTYVLRNGHLKGIPLAFERDAEIDDLAMYVFSYRGPAEYTEVYARKTEFEGLVVEAGQVVRCADGQFVYRAWVEPLTGEIVKAEEGCFSGDYLYDEATGVQLTAVDRFGGIMAGNDVLQHVHAVRRERAWYLGASRVVPWGLVVLGGIVLLTAMRRTPRRVEGMEALREAA